MLSSLSAMYCANLRLSPSANPIWPLNDHVQSPKIHHRLEDRCSHRRLDKAMIVVPAVSQQSLALSETPGSTRTSTTRNSARDSAPRVTRPCQPLGTGSAASLKIALLRIHGTSTVLYTDSRHYRWPAPASVSLSPSLPRFALSLVMTETCSPGHLVLGAGSASGRLGGTRVNKSPPERRSKPRLAATEMRWQADWTRAQRIRSLPLTHQQFVAAARWIGRTANPHRYDRWGRHGCPTFRQRLPGHSLA